MKVDLRSLVVTGIRWTVLARLIQQASYYATLIILAHLVTPASYGLVGMVAVFSGFGMVLAEFGFGSAIVQASEISDEQVSGIFWINLATGCVLYLLFFLGAPWVAAFYHTPELRLITQVSAVTFLLGPLAIVSRALLQRRMDFGAIARVEVTAAVVSNVTAIVLALLGHGVWALVFSALANSACTMLFMFRAARFWPRFRPRLDRVRGVLRYGGNLTGFSAINYWGRNADNLIIGKALGAHDLGVYGRAYALMLLPLTQIVSMVSGVMFSAMCSIQDDKARAKRLYLRANALIAFFAFPMMAGLFAVADPFVNTLLGSEWGGVIPLLRILSFVGAMQSLGNPGGWIFMSQGRTDWMFRWGVAANACIIGAILAGAYVGTVEGIAYAYLIINVILVGPAIDIPGRLIGLRAFEVGKAVSGITICSVLMAVSVLAIAKLLPPTLPSWQALAIQVPSGVALYAGCCCLFRLRVLSDLPIILPGRLRRSVIV